MRTILLGQPITSTEALEAGLVCNVFDQHRVLDGAIEAAVTLAGQPPIALKMAKEAICRGESHASGGPDVMDAEQY